MIRNLNHLRLLSDLCVLQRKELFLDLELVCGNPPDFQTSILCHQLILAAFSPTICQALKMSPDSLEKQIIFIPDSKIDDVRSLILQVYDCYDESEKGSSHFTCSSELASLFGLSTPLKYEKPEDAVVSERDLREKISPMNSDLNFDHMLQIQMKKDVDMECTEEEFEEFGCDIAEEYLVPVKIKLKRKRTHILDKEPSSGRTVKKKKKKGLEKWMTIEADSSEEEDLVSGLKRHIDRFHIELDNTIQVDVKPIAIADEHVQQQLGHEKERNYYNGLMFSCKLGWKKCLMGVRHLSDGNFEVKPFVSDETPKRNILGNFDKITHLIKNLYGLKLPDMLLNSIVFAEFEDLESCNSILLNKLHQKYKTFSQKSLEEENSKAVTKLKEISAVCCNKCSHSIKAGSKIKLILNESLSTDCFEEVVLLVWKKEDFKCHKIHFNQDMSWTLLLMDIWQRESKQIEDSRNIKKKLFELYVLTIMPDLMQKLLQKKILEPDRASICPHCGKVFPIKSSNHRTLFARHLEIHKEQDFQCKCDITFGTPKDKRNHFRMNHSGEDYAMCQFCDEAFKQDGIQQHIQSFHKTFVCDTCGFTVNNKAYYDTHYYERHKPLKCDICNVTIAGKKNFLTHQKEKHSICFSCEFCPSTFKYKCKLNAHIRTMHTREQDKKYQCKDCEKGFIYPQKLRMHMISMHIKSRPFKCRYGCENVDYNDPSNRSTHEKKHHGGLKSKFVDDEEMEAVNNIRI